MATNMIFRYDGKKTRERPVPSGTLTGVPLIVGGRPAVTLTARGDATVSHTNPDGTVTSGIPAGGVGNAADSASLAFDGTWEFEVTGATTSTASDVAVYITSGGVLTLTVGSNTAYGFTDYPVDYNKVAGIAPVRIGA